MTEFASRWPNMRRWAISRIRAAVEAQRVSAERSETLPDGAPLHTQVVVSVAPSRLETPVSRQYLVTVEAWSYEDAVLAKDNAHDLCAEAAYEIESAPRDGNPVVRAELNAGPTENRDEAGHYYYTATVMVVAHRLP